MNQFDQIEAPYLFFFRWGRAEPRFTAPSPENWSPRFALRHINDARLGEKVSSDEDRWSEVSGSTTSFEILGVAELVKLRVEDEALCAVCRRRNFKKLFFQLVGDSGYHFPTRTLAHVKKWSSSCNFCRLTLAALNLDAVTAVCPDEEEMLVRSNYPRSSGSLESTKDACYFWFELERDERRKISLDFHNKNKIYFYLHPRAHGFDFKDEDMRFQRTTHNIQLCLDSTEPFAWHSNRHPKLQLLSGRLMSEEVDVEMLKTWLRMSDSAILSVTSTTNFHSQPATDAGAQDDKEEVAAQIAYMGQIYQSAALAIVQASADPDTSVHTPLRGLLPGSRKIRQEQVIIQDEQVLCTHRPPFTGAIKRSKWNMRGWTLQERFLSRRLLYFTDHQVFMTSAAGHFFCEDTVFEHEKDDIHAYSRVSIPTLSFDWDYDPLAKELLPTPAEGLLYLVSNYTERLLSNQDDALAAFSALMTTFVHDLGFADFGIPRKIFDYAFCWSPAGSVRRRTKFPSWCWAGWEGSIRFHHDFHPERCRSSVQYGGYSARPSFAGKTIIDGTKNRFKKLRETHGLQVGPLALTEGEVQNYYRNLLGHDRQGGNPVHERFLLHFVTTCRSLQIGAIEQNPPGPAEREKAGEGTVEERHAGSFYELKGTEGTKLPQSISIVKEWRLSQPDQLSVDFIAICTASTWRREPVPRAEDDGSDYTEADEEQSSVEFDGNVPMKKRTRGFELGTNSFLNLVPITWGHARACGCCDTRHKVAQRIGPMSVVTMPWNDCIKEWIALKPQETLVIKISITEAVMKTLRLQEDPRNTDYEFAQRDGALHVLRICPDELFSTLLIRDGGTRTAFDDATDEIAKAATEVRAEGNLRAGQLLLR
ncbi:hypothetical protein DL767_003656 [Monosporascus sp. MG133]|nr:hypothetical protein DL767_003656 [Monosporascus sp. MG133]